MGHKSAPDEFYCYYLLLEIVHEVQRRKEKKRKEKTHKSIKSVYTQIDSVFDIILWHKPIYSKYTPETDIKVLITIQQ